jgi:hypothetical protein
MRVFRGGLRHIPAKSDSLIYGTKNSMHNFHDKLTYERVINFIKNLYKRVGFNTQDLQAISISLFITCMEDLENLLQSVFY